MTSLEGFLGVILPAALWAVSLRILGWGQPAPAVGRSERWRYVTEFIGAPLWAALVLVGDGLTWWIERGERS